MISVVICSVNPRLAAQVKRNIDETIGVPYELVVIDNANSNKGICSVYNSGARQAIHEILCFVHEDVLFRTKGWGKIVANYFNSSPNAGILGVAGTKYKASTPSGWSTGYNMYDCCNILHLNKQNVEERIYLNPEPNKRIQEVVCVDGVFICASKKAWSELPFNENQLKGFHVYDIDFSLSISRKYRVDVTFEIDLVHLTEGGDYGDKWLEATLQWHQANSHFLPATVEGAINGQYQTERKIQKFWLRRLQGEKISGSNRRKWVLETKSYFYPQLWPRIAVFLLYRVIKRHPRS